ncbi:hypothetical protein Q4I30_000479 [Leishmania utingensis]|uniref:Uncharacterized protein n=1 Tax=Leishmania utingensis TaxID=653362 RepID=A0AAW3B1I7_9TRYP
MVVQPGEVARQGGTVLHVAVAEALKLDRILDPFQLLRPAANDADRLDADMLQYAEHGLAGLALVDERLAALWQLLEVCVELFVRTEFDVILTRMAHSVGDLVQVHVEAHFRAVFVNDSTSVENGVVVYVTTAQVCPPRDLVQRGENNQVAVLLLNLFDSRAAGLACRLCCSCLSTPL